MYPMVLFPTPSEHPSEHDKLRIFLSVLNGQITSRRDAVTQFAMRSTTVSEHVTELLEKRLLTEIPGPRKQRGRPTIDLIANPHRLVVLVFKVVSQYLQIACVNLAGQIIHLEQMHAPTDSDNSALRGIFNNLLKKMLPHVPQSSEISGVCFSLPGLVDTVNPKWIFCARWPQMKHLPLDSLLEQQSWPVSTLRTLDAELLARLSNSTQSTLLLHWGYGVGMAFGKDNKIVTGGSGFGEIGHWRVASENGLCKCGNHGCLETKTALWALGEKLWVDPFSINDDELQVASHFKTQPMLTYPAITEAIALMQQSLSNICRIFFPERIFVSGPFVANPAVWAVFYDGFINQNAFVNMPLPELIAGHRSHEFEINGAARNMLEQGLLNLVNGAN